MDIIPIKRMPLHIRNLSQSGGPSHAIGFDRYVYIISYEFGNVKRMFTRSTKTFKPIGDLILEYENKLEFYTTLDPENDLLPNELIQYDSVYNIGDDGNGRGFYQRI